MLNNVWHKRLEFAGGETIVIHNPNVIVHFRATAQPDEWGTTQVRFVVLHFYMMLLFGVTRVANILMSRFTRQFGKGLPPDL